MVSKNDQNEKKGDNVVSFEASHDKSKEKNFHHNQKTPSEPLINLPNYTKYLLGLLVTIHLLITFLPSNEQALWVIFNLGFIPGRFSDTVSLKPWAFITPFTHMFIHGGWLHLSMNGFMLLAFGSGVEKWLGGKKMIAFFIACGLFGIAIHFALNFHSTLPVVGASGGISGLFAAAIVMINKTQGGIAGRYGLWPIVILWVLVSVIFGFVSTPQMGISKGEIAWATHVGGLLGGLAILKIMKIY